jgi:hypothetical protein
MKKNGIALFLLFSTFFVACAQDKSGKNTKPLSPRITTEGKFIKVAYGQPSKRGRVIFGDLEPYGEVWRTGANQATEITFTKNVLFANKPVKAGTYTLFSIPDKNHWTLILNGQLGQWGAFEYEKHKVKDIAKVSVPVKTLPEVVEKLTFTIKEKTSGADISIAWDQTVVVVPITIQK